MADELGGVGIRLERAHEHIDTLKHESRMFMMERPQPYGWAIADKPVDGEYIMRARVLRPPSARLGVLAADAAHNLRAALDMVAWELALIGPNPPAEDDRSTAFPICTNDDAWNSPTTKRMIERIPKDAISVIYSLQPYNTPDKPPRLRVIQSIDNWAKHKAIPNLLSFHISRVRPLTQFEVVALKDGAFEDDDEICRVRSVEPVANPIEHFRGELMCHVGFSKNGPGFGWPIDFLDNTYKEIRDEVLPAFWRFFS